MFGSHAFQIFLGTATLQSWAGTCHAQESRKSNISDNPLPNLPYAAQGATEAFPVIHPGNTFRRCSNNM
eukprot:980647-Amphidinium_carterae.1